MIDSELIIRTRKEDDVHELLPLWFLESDFPKTLVQDYAHWLHLSTETVEWRPFTHMLEPAQCDLLMQGSSNRDYRLSYNGKVLVDIRSQTFQEISRILSPLEIPTDIHVMYDEPTSRLNIHLPRFKLDFLVRPDGQVLESVQYRGMTVDKVQSIGTFSGLASKLVLCSMSGDSRIVLVPQGDVSFEPDGHHLRVAISTGEASYVHYHAYTVDNQLGRLVDNGSLQSRLFRIYLQ